MKTTTIAIPVYNGEKFILEALQSIIKQTVKVDKIIICDNHSNDRTIEIVNQFKDDHKDWDIQLHESQENLGFQKNFMRCYDLPKTDFLLILHADDLLKHATIEKQLTFFDQNPEFAAVGGHADIINSEGDILQKNIITKNGIFKKNQIYELYKATGAYIVESTVMYNLKLTREVNFTDKETLGPEELFWPNLLKLHPIAVLSDSLICNREHEGQLHIKNSVKKFNESIMFFKEKLNMANLEESLERQIKTKKIIKEQNARISIRIGWKTFRQGKNLRVALKYFVYAVGQNKRIIFTKFFIKQILNK